MHVETSTDADYASWLILAEEVEPLFGPMRNEKEFQTALIYSLKNEEAFCIRTQATPTEVKLVGGIIISKEFNEIMWLAVAGNFQGNGYGKMLLAKALVNLDSTRSIRVQTFAESSPVGNAARKLYLSFGFTDYQDAGNNPAGISTVIMCKD